MIFNRSQNVSQNYNDLHQQIYVETKIVKYTEEYNKQIISVWEKSVRATHLFVSEADIAYFKEIVGNIDFNAFEVYCLLLDKNIIGFVGVAEKNIETLFLEPNYIGKGHGKKLILFAIDELKAEKVEVNEKTI